MSNAAATRSDPAPMNATTDDSWFSRTLLNWFDRNGLHDLPWQDPRTPYRVWIAELMLQQTQVQVVIPYFQRFVQRFPHIDALAAAALDTVMPYWAGLGYYARARHAHRAAQLCVDHHDGDLPSDFAALCALPGIGRSTAGAILAQAWNQRFPILDGNVKRLFCRFDGLAGYPGQSAVNHRLWERATQRVQAPPAHRIADYTQAQMDFGATVCTRHRPLCSTCPFTSRCVAYRSAMVDSLPSRKPSKQLPTRSAVAVVTRNPNGEILLQRRPQSGIWASLWTLPQSDSTTALRQWCKAHLSKTRWKAAEQLTRIEHAFSHYRLSLDVWVIPSNGLLSHLCDTPDFRWVAPCQSAEIALPAPIRKLFSTICHAQP